VAAKWGKSNMVSLLLESGANIEAKTRDGLTALHCAARSGHNQVIDMLLQRNAPISSKTKVSLGYKRSFVRTTYSVLAFIIIAITAYRRKRITDSPKRNVNFCIITLLFLSRMD